MKRLLALSAGVALLATSQAFAAGFEKSIPWGGETAGLAGIGTPYVQNSQALFFNPAGLLGDKVGQDVSFNLTALQPTVKAPVFNKAAQETAESATLTPFGLIYGHTLNDKLGYGFGFYSVGGLATSFNGLKITGLGGDFDVKADLKITELSLGAGYKVMDNLKVGAAWRMGMISAALGAPKAVNATTIDEGQYSDLEGSSYLGLRLGAQYKLSDDTQLGFTYRSEMTYEAKGKLNYSRHSVGTETQILTDQDVTVGTLLPAAWTLGAVHKLNASWNLYGEYVFTEYSKATNISTEVNGAGSTPIELKWKDQHNLRLAAAYSGFGMPVRFGYVWTSQVSNPDYAGPTTTPPGAASTFTLGTGKAFGNVNVNGGFDYTTVSGKVTGYTAENEATSYALHLGADYSF